MNFSVFAIVLPPENKSRIKNKMNERQKNTLPVGKSVRITLCSSSHHPASRGCWYWHLIRQVAGLHRASPSTSLDKRSHYEISRCFLREAENQRFPEIPLSAGKLLYLFLKLRQGPFAARVYYPGPHGRRRGSAPIIRDYVAALNQDDALSGEYEVVLFPRHVLDALP